jgi:hypothetical protein
MIDFPLPGSLWPRRRRLSSRDGVALLPGVAPDNRKALVILATESTDDSRGNDVVNLSQERPP